METDKRVLELNLEDILPNRFQPRINFNEAAIEELAESIKEHGVIQPIVVRPLADKYEIIAGERRYKAAMMAGRESIPAIVTDLNDKDSAEVALIENVQRQDLTPIEEAISYKKILDMGYLTQDQLADKLGKTQSTIANKLRLLNLDEEVQDALLEERISERHARSLLKLTDYEMQRTILERIINERLTVRKTDEEIEKALEHPELFAKTEKKEIEVVDFDQEEEEVDQQNNQFNIPMNPIIDEVVEEPKIELPTVPVTDPGFMDVEHIQDVAQDIYQEKPLANLDHLLEPTVAPVAPSSPVVEETEDDDDDAFMLKPGKFFNMFEPLEEEPKEEKGFTPVPPVMPSFDTQFNPFGEMAPVEPAMPVTSAEPVIPVVVESEVAAPSVTPVMEMPNVVPVTSFDPFATQPVQSTPTVMVETEPENLDFDQLFHEPPVTEVVTPIVEEPTIEMPTFEEPMVPEVEVKEQPQVYNNFALRGEEEIELRPQVTAVPSTHAVSDMKTVINTIRTCANTIEKYGYDIDSEELDFEDSYQVIFTIKKK